MDFIADALRERRLGLALHYPLLHATVVGLAARRTLEFGAGGSTRVIVDALPEGGMHTSISMEPGAALIARYGVRAALGRDWVHLCGDSASWRLLHPDPLELILHDGSHAADVVAGDIAWAWPYLRRYGLLLVHDTQHSYVGAEMRAGVARGLAAAGVAVGQHCSMTTLPYGFGLTIIRREEGGPGAVKALPAKLDSPHTTEPKELIHGGGA